MFVRKSFDAHRCEAIDRNLCKYRSYAGAFYEFAVIYGPYVDIHDDRLMERKLEDFFQREMAEKWKDFSAVYGLAK